MDGDSVEPVDWSIGIGILLGTTVIAATSGIAGLVLFASGISGDDDEDPYTLAYYWPLIPSAVLGVSALVLGVVSATKTSGSVWRILLAVFGITVGAAVALAAVFLLWVFGVDQPLID